MPSNSTEYNKQYRQNNKERLREIRSKWNEDNADKMREYRRRYFQEHKDKWREYWKKHTKKYYYQQLEEENRNLRYELDKFSEAYKKYRDYEKEELAESCYDLARENARLKEELWKIVMSEPKNY